MLTAFQDSEPGKPSRRKNTPASKNTVSVLDQDKHDAEAIIEVEKPDNKDDKDKAKPGSMKDYFRVLTSGTPLDKAYQSFAVILAIATGAALPMMPLIFGRLVNLMTDISTPSSSLSPGKFQSEVNRFALYFFLLFLGKFILGSISMTLFRVTGTRISASVRLRYVAALFRQDITFFDNTGAGSVGVKITTNSNLLQTGISEKLGMGIASLSTIIAAYIVAFTRSWELTLVTSTVLPAAVLVYSITAPIDIRKNAAIMASYSAAATLAQEILASMRTVKAFNAEPKLLNKYQTHLDDAKRRGLAKAPLMAVQFAALHGILWAGCALCFWHGSRMLEAGRLANPGEIWTVFLAVIVGIVAVMGVISPITAMTSAAGAAASMWEVVDRVPTIDAGDEGGEKLGEGWRGRIRLENVVFGYPGTREDVKILNGLDLEFEEGKTTAIVGPSGSGKSTIVALLERWYDPNSSTSSTEIDPKGEGKISVEQGQILIDETPLPSLNLKWWRRQIGLVQQEPFLFNDTILSNVLFGLIGTEWENETGERKKELVIDACKEANAHDFIIALPNGYDTQVGERGTYLSGGQKQRISIARSIIKNPRILILDEATSALDPKAERIVQDCLDRLAKTRTTIMIAHRLSTVKKADKIVVLDGGMVVESGDHDGLIAAGGRYATLVEAQRLTFGKKDEVEEEEEEEEVIEEIIALQRTATKAESTAGREKNDIEAGASISKEPQMGAFNAFRTILWENRKHSFLFLIALIGVLMAASSYPVQAFLFGSFIDNFSDSTTDDILDGASFWSLMFLVLALGVATAYSLMGHSFTRLQHHLTSRYRAEYVRSFMHQEISYFDMPDHSSGTLSSQLDSDPTAIQEMMGTNFGMLLVAVTAILGIVIISLSYGWKLALVTICSAFPLVITAGMVRMRFEQKLDKASGKIFADSSKFISEAVSAFRTVSSLTLETKIISEYESLLTGQVGRAFRHTAVSMVLLSLSESVTLAAAALVFWYGSRLMVSGELAVKNYFVVYMALIFGGESSGQFFAFAPNMVTATSAVNRIVNLRPKPETGSILPEPLRLDEQARGLEIEFRNVTFQYPTRPTPVFKNLNLKIASGSFTAFVGPSGCGKTTLISLLERFYDLKGEGCKGEILVNGQNLDGLDIKDYRTVVALVSQEPQLYQGSLKENILLGINEEGKSKEELDAETEKAAKEAYIHTFITSLPSSYSTDLGASGVSLSGGQKQRVAIARALIKSPRLLLLDEATSALDSNSEKVVQQALEEARSHDDRTVVAVAHRLSTIVGADEIVVFAPTDGGWGEVVERGKHEDLVRKGGVYAGLVKAQALDRAE